MAESYKIIDAHAHIIPDKIGNLLPEGARLQLSVLRKKSRDWLRPFSSTLHKSQTMLRHFPDPIRKRLDQIAGLSVLPNLLFEGTLIDFQYTMKDAGVDAAIIIAQPPFIPNEFIMEIAATHAEFIPVVNIPPGTSRPGEHLKNFVNQGAKALKIHPPADGEGPESPRYRALLKTAEQLGLPVILHTGCMQSHILYKDPEGGEAQAYSPWFEKYKNVKFILAHMNFHHPMIAMDLAEEFENVYLDTSWQPAEIIGESVRRLGPEKIMFGSDWPFVGNNLRVGKKRVFGAVEIGMIQEKDAEKILGQNAARVFGI